MKRFLSPRFWLLWVALWLMHTTPAIAQTGAESEKVETFPGVAQVVPRLAALTEQERLVKVRIASLRDVSEFEGQIQQVRNRQEGLKQRLEELGDPQDWNVNRLLENRGIVAMQQDLLGKTLENLSQPLATLDQIRQEWLKKEGFWSRWKSSFKKEQIQITGEPFSQAHRIIESVLAVVDEAMGPLVAQQKEVTALQEANQQTLSRIDALLDALRKETFKRTALPLYSSEFYRQFDDELWRTARSGLKDLRRPYGDFFAEQGWVLLIQFGLAIGLALVVRRHRDEAYENEEWRFMLLHPWSTGIFVAVSALSVLFVSPPALIRVVFWALAAFSAAVLISALLQNPRKIFMVYLLAVLFLFSVLLNAIALPLPLYRLYIMLLAVAGAPALWGLARRNRRAKEGKKDGFSLSLQFGALVLLGTGIAQLWGYSRLALRIVESSVETVFLGLFLMMVVRLGRGGIDYFLRLPTLRHYRFFKRYGDELAGRLKGFLQFLAVLYAFFYLMAVWGIFDTVQQAWQGIVEFGVEIGDQELSLRMLLLAGFVLYLASSLSWVLQTLLETGVMAQRRVDRGVRDSIKKLLHYSVVLLGFVLAMNLLGFGLQNFVVLAGAFGIGIGFGLQNIVNNFISGIILLFERPVKVGDMVVVDEEWGRVRKIGLRSTVVETLDQAEIIVPNSMFISEKVTNWSLSTTVVRIVVPVGVAYGSDVGKVLKVLDEVCRDHDEILADPAPSPIFVGFGDSSLDFELRAWISDVNNRLRIRSELGMAVDRRFREEGVTIPFPQRDLHFSSVEGSILEAVRSLRHPEEEAARGGIGKETDASPERR